MAVIEAAGTVRRMSPLQALVARKLDIAGAAMEITAKKAASRKFPMQFLCDIANAVLDGDTGELLEYRHLMAHPKCREIWG